MENINKAVKIVALEGIKKLSNEALDLLEMKGEKEKEETNTALGNVTYSMQLITSKRY